MFPAAQSRDVVDTMTQVLLWLSRNGRLIHPDDKEWYKSKSKHQKQYYGPEEE